jgi:hypothetical protein
MDIVAATKYRQVESDNARKTRGLGRGRKAKL